jgi:hypothetical protein
MQPEANIDVWGRPYSNQVELVRRLLLALPEDGRVAIKANPKSKYEVSGDLIRLAQGEPRIVLLPLDWKMPQAQAVSIGSVTVSGTVGYEAVFGRGRCLSLRHPVIRDHFPSFHADSPEEAVVRLIADSDAGKGNRNTAEKLLAWLLANSFPGTINEPAYNPNCTSAENIRAVTEALLTAISVVDQKRNCLQ